MLKIEIINQYMLCFVFKLVFRLAFKYLVAMEKEQLSPMQWVWRPALLTAWCYVACSSCSVFSQGYMAATDMLPFDLVCTCEWFPPLSLSCPLWMPFHHLWSYLCLLCLFFQRGLPSLPNENETVSKALSFLSQIHYFLYIWSVRDTKFAAGKGKRFATNISFFPYFF